jgi:hypothetical protein
MTNIPFSSYPFHPLIPPATSIPIHSPPAPAPPIPCARRPSSCVAALRRRSSSGLPTSLAPLPRHSPPCACLVPHHPPPPLPGPAASNLSQRRISPAWALRLLRPTGLPRAIAPALFPVRRAPTCPTILLLRPLPPLPRWPPRVGASPSAMEAASGAPPSAMASANELLLLSAMARDPQGAWLAKAARSGRCSGRSCYFPLRPRVLAVESVRRGKGGSDSGWNLFFSFLLHSCAKNSFLSCCLSCAKGTLSQRCYLGSTTLWRKRYGTVRHGYHWVPTDQAHGCPRQVGPAY